MATVEVELDDFNTIDLIGELSDRLSKKGMKRISHKERNRVMAALNEMSDQSAVMVIPLISIDDQSKKEIILKAWENNTSFQLEEKLK